MAGPSADAAFTIGNYPVDAVAKDAVQAKDKALADGQQAAFRSLLRRLVPVTSYRRLNKLTPVKPADLVDGVAVRSESNSSTQYIASLDFSFQPQAVRNYLKREGMPFVDTQSPEVIVVPILRDAQGKPLEAGPWIDAWKGLDLAHALAPVKVESLKPAVHADTVKMTISGDGGAERILSGEYGSDRVVLVVADVDNGARKVNVVMAGQDAVGPFTLKRAWRLGADQAYTFELAAVVGLGVLEGRWKATQAPRGGASSEATAWGQSSGGQTWGGQSQGGQSPSGQSAPWSAPGQASQAGQLVRLEAEFSSIAQWNDIRSQLLDTPGVEGVEISSMSARGASINLRYPGGGEKLSEALGRQGLVLRNTGNAWRLTGG